MYGSEEMPHPPPFVPAMSRSVARRIRERVRKQRIVIVRLFTGLELHSLRHRALHVALVFSISDGVAFVVLGFAFADAEGDFGVCAGEIELEGDEGDAFDIDGSCEAFYFSFFGQEHAIAFGSVVESAGGLVWGDIGLVEGQAGWVEVYGDEALFERAVALADTFDL